VIPGDGVTVAIDGRSYGGPITVTAGDSGLVVIEETEVESYLLGIAEVPFVWPTEALRAQAIAARSYLAWTLDRGRSANGRRFGYDICATDRCQVYRGLSGVRSDTGYRWSSAVMSTAGEILVVDGSPLQALYSSTSGGRTRSVEDVFGGTPNQHLRAVASTDESSPFTDWRFPIEFDEMEALVREAGHLNGDLLTVRTRLTADGQGPWMVDIVGTGGVVSVGTWQLRTDLNRAASTLFPERFPVTRPDESGHRYPQTIMSPTFVIGEMLRYTPEWYGPRVEPYFEVQGHGWGHLVGMSQYGAEAMARNGSSAEEILSHFYGGLTPQAASGILPETVRIGLTTDSEAVSLEPDGPVTVRVDGRTVAETTLGSWALSWDTRAILVSPPVGLGLAPDIEVLRVFELGGTISLITGRLVSAAELRVTVEVSGRVVEQSDWTLTGAGFFVNAPRVERSTRAPVRVTVESRSPQGTDSRTVAFVSSAR